MSLYPQDKKAGFLGLIGSVIVLMIIVYAMVLLTNSMFEGHGPAEAAAEGHLRAPGAASDQPATGAAPATPTPASPESAATAPAAAPPAANP